MKGCNWWWWLDMDRRGISDDGGCDTKRAVIRRYDGTNSSSVDDDRRRRRPRRSDTGTSWFKYTAVNGVMPLLLWNQFWVGQRDKQEFASRESSLIMAGGLLANNIIHNDHYSVFLKVLFQATSSVILISYRCMVHVSQLWQYDLMKCAATISVRLLLSPITLIISLLLNEP